MSQRKKNAASLFAGLPQPTERIIGLFNSLSRLYERVTANEGEYPLPGGPCV
jgi:hypothetical protein